MADQQDTTDRTVSVAEAAGRLGLSTDAIRKRLNRGTLPGVKDGREWRVIIDDEPDDQPDAGASDGTPPHDEGSRVSDLLGTIADLRSRLDTADDRTDALITDLRNERQRADTLQALNLQAQDRIRELEALTTGAADDSEGAGSPESGDSEAMGINTPTNTDNPSVSAWTRFWRGLLGGG